MRSGRWRILPLFSAHLTISCSSLRTAVSGGREMFVGQPLKQQVRGCPSALWWIIVSQLQGQHLQNILRPDAKLPRQVRWIGRNVPKILGDVFRYDGEGGVAGRAYSELLVAASSFLFAVISSLSWEDRCWSCVRSSHGDCHRVHGAECALLPKKMIGLDAAWQNGVTYRDTIY